MARLPYVVPYDPGFLGDGFQVPMPAPRCTGKLYQSGQQIDYIHFSLVLHQDRKLALYTAHNIDVSKRRSVPRDGWALDPRVEHGSQTGAAAYKHNPWDRGHLVRRAAVAWGDTASRAQAASDSTFYYTNAAPQHEKFNQDEWLALEDWVLSSAGGVAPRLCVLTGPIYTTLDEMDGTLRIPSAFWKVVVLRDPTASGDDLSALGFVMKQNEMWKDWNGSQMIDFTTYQVGLAEIGGFTGLDFGPLALLDEFEWRQARFRDRTRMRPVQIGGPKDIRFHGDRRRERGIRAPRLATSEEPEAAAPERKGACPTCAGDATEGTTEDKLEAVTQQLDALREIVDSLMLEDDSEDSETRSTARADARQAYERIVGGAMVGVDEFPDCACIGDDDSWFCSGVLIHKRVVVTAAHCAPDIDRVYLGGRSLSLIGSLGEVVEVEKVHVHPDYDPWAVPSHDIAVLVLKKDATSAPVKPATAEEVQAEGNVSLVGFGYEHPTLNIGFGTKRRVDIDMMNLTGFEPHKIEEIEEKHGFDDAFELYAGRKQLGKDSCNGDSGGPCYIHLDDDTFRLAGVTSRAAFSSEVRCGDGGIYTRTAPYLAWMHDVTGGLVGAAADTDDGGGDGQELAEACVYVSAAQPNAAAQDAGNEWIEVTNAGTEATSLVGFTVADKQGGVEPLGGVLTPGATRRFVLPKNSEVKLGNKGDEIVLQREGKELHRVSYTSAGAGEIFNFANPCTGPGGGGGGNGDGGGGGGGGGVLPNADPC